MKQKFIKLPLIMASILILGGCAKANEASKKEEESKTVDSYEMDKATFEREINPYHVIKESNYHYQLKYNHEIQLEADFNYGTNYSIFTGNTYGTIFHIEEIENDENINFHRYTTEDGDVYYHQVDYWSKERAVEYYFSPMTYLFTITYESTKYNPEKKGYDVIDEEMLASIQMTSAFLQAKNNKPLYMQFVTLDNAIIEMTFSRHGLIQTSIPENVVEANNDLGGSGSDSEPTGESSDEGSSGGEGVAPIFKK